MTSPILIIAGPTASGKTSLALSYAKQEKQPCAIINADAMQLYAGIEIITAQPTPAEQEDIPHYLYGVRDPSEACSVGQWITLASECIDRCHAEGVVPLLVGGTGMYLSSLMQGLAEIPDIPGDVRDEVRCLHKELGPEAFHAKLDPVMQSRLPVSDTQRVLRAYEVWVHTGKSLAYWQERPRKIFYPRECFNPYVVELPRETLYAQCNARLLQMIEAGAVEEVTALQKRGLSTDLPAMKSLGVPELLGYIQGESSLEEAVSAAQQSTRRYAKRQMTWFRNQMKEVVRVKPGDVSGMLQ